MFIEHCDLQVRSGKVVVGQQQSRQRLTWALRAGIDGGQYGARPTDARQGTQPPQVIAIEERFRIRAHQPVAGHYRGLQRGPTSRPVR